MSDTLQSWVSVFRVPLDKNEGVVLAQQGWVSRQNPYNFLV
jgi:hypothetical protein